MKDKTIYEVNKVSKGYKFWQKSLRNKLFNYFVFGGLDPSLPSSEIMIRLIRDGWCAIFKHPKYGMVTCNGGLSGVDIYGHETTFVYAQPILGSGTLTIGKDVAIIGATKEFWYTKFRPMDIINRYAKQLADIDATFNIAVVNARASKLYGGIDKGVRDSLKEVIENMREGDFDVVTEPPIINAIKEHESKQELDVSDIITARDSIEKSFWEEFGVHITARKTERFLKDELSGDSQLLDSIRGGFLDSVSDGFARVNDIFGTNYTVDINPTYVPQSEIASQVGMDNGFGNNGFGNNGGMNNNVQNG